MWEENADRNYPGIIFLQFYIDVMVSHEWCRGREIDMGIMCPQGILSAEAWPPITYRERERQVSRTEFI